MYDYLKRMLEEHEELSTRIERLKNFQTPANEVYYKQVSEKEKKLLMNQYYAMKLYNSALKERISIHLNLNDIDLDDVEGEEPLKLKDTILRPKDLEKEED